MAIKTADWVVVETTTSGKGNISLGPAVQGYTSFTASFGESTDVYYSIISGNGNRECGVGVFNKSSNTLTRSNVMTTIVNGVLLRDKQPISLSGKSTISCTINSSTIDDIIAAIGAGGGGGGGGSVQQPTISVGTVQTGLPNTLAVVENTGDNINAVFDFVIPRGADGADGTGGSGSSGKYLGVASTTTPLTPPFYAGDFYATSTPGTYANFGGLVVGSELAFLRYNSSAWVKDTVYVAQGVARTGITLGKVISGWIHVKSVKTTSGVTTYVYEVGANTTIEFTSSSSTSLYSTSTVVLNANNNGPSVEYIQSTSNLLGSGKAAIAIDLATNQPVILSGAVSTSERMCLISYQVSSVVSTQRSIFQSNHFFSVEGLHQNPDITQTQFRVDLYGAATFTDAVDNSAALFYAKWAAQVVNRARKRLTISDYDTTPPEIDIVFPPGVFLADFSTTKYKPSVNDGPYSAGYWSVFAGTRLVGGGLDITNIKYTGGDINLNILYARDLTFHRIQTYPATSSNVTSIAEVTFKNVRYYAEGVDAPSGRIIGHSKAKKVHLKGCIFDYRNTVYAPVEIINYDEVIVEDCVFNPSKLGFATHLVRVEAPLSKFSRYYNRRNQVYKGTTGAFSRLLNTHKPMVGTVIEDNYFDGIVEESVAIDGIGDSTAAPVIGNGLITSVEQPSVCPGEHQWLRWGTIGPNSASAWSTPVCLTSNTTSTAYAFKASANQPSPPTGTDLVPSGWSGVIPVSNDPIWMSTATITGGLAVAWSTPMDITEVRCFRTGTTVSPPTGYINLDPGWSLAAPALPFTNVWVSKTHSVNGMLRGANNQWSTPVKIDSTPEQASWIEYRTGTTFSNTVAPGTDGAIYKLWRNSPWAHNLVIGADLRRLSNSPVAIARSMEDFFFVFEDDSGREGTVCDILYADPVTQKLTLNLDAPVDSINIGGWCGVHSGLFDSVIRRNRINNGATAISLFMNVFGNLVEDNTVLNCNTNLSITGMLAQSYLRCRAHNNIIRGNVFQGMREESYIPFDPTRAIVSIDCVYANDPDHRNFNNSVTDNIFIGGVVQLRYQGNLTWDNNRLIDVAEIERTHCRMALPAANSAAAGQIATKIQDDRDVMSAHAISVASMVSGQLYLYYKLSNTNWATIFSELTGNQLPGLNQGYTYNGNTPTGSGQVMPLSIPAKSMVAGGTYRISTVGDTNWTAIGAANNTYNTVFVYNGVEVTGNGTARPHFLGSPTSITYHVCKLVNNVYSWVEI